MINYSSLGYYYFLFLSVIVFSVLIGKVEKKLIIAFLCLSFQFLFFYFFKIQLVFLWLMLIFNWLVIKFFILKVKKKKNELISFFVVFNILVFVLVKYKYFCAFVFGDKLDIQVFSFLGYSFFNFRIISLLVDIKRGVTKEIDTINFFNYLTFFPVFLSGPIDQYSSFEKEINGNHLPNNAEFLDAVFRLVWGVFKKVVIANLLHNFSIDGVSAESLKEFSYIKKIIVLYVYAFELYFDFSGYSDMAIGISRLYGIKVSENFNRPFSSVNIQEFWNRWHISFMKWLRDYIYYPFHYFLIKKLKLSNYLLTSVLATALIFIVAGLWHGDKIQYFYYGFYHSISFSLFLVWRNFIQNKEMKSFKEKYIDTKWFKVIAQFLTLNYFVIGLLFFTGRYVAVFK